MNLREFQKASVPDFRGLYRRGSNDRVPNDHAVDLSNLDFNKSGDTFTRWGTNLGLNLSHPVARFFLATTLGPNQYYLLTYDGYQSLYIYDMVAGMDYLLYTDPALKGFYAVNEWGKCFVLPAGADFTNTMKMQVIYWSETAHSMLVRPALGHATNVVFSVNPSFLTGGNIDPGVHKFAVSFITDTGFTTRPGPVSTIDNQFYPVVATFDGTHKAGITGLPIGPYGTVARQIFVTKADEEEFFYLADGFINDNTTTGPITLDWFDTDLALSADSLFDLREEISGAATSNSGIFKYRGRTLVWIAGTLGLDYIAVSNVAEPEAFDKSTGFIQVPSESDGNYVSGCANLRDVLYITKTVGIYSTQDNFDNPNTWLVVQVDGGIGCTFYAMSTITVSQTALSINEFLLFADIGGIYAFNGTVIQPPITWKIDDIWKRVSKAYMRNITIAVDPFKQVLYCLVPIDGSATPSLLLVGTATDGIDYQNIKWSIYNLPQCVRCIGMLNIKDNIDFQYLLRFGTDSNGLYRLDPAATDDSGTPITAYWQSSLQSYEPGKLSIFRALVIRGQGTNFQVSLGAQDGQRIQVMNTFSMTLHPGLEYTRQINYTSEKMAVKLLSSNYFHLGRIDFYGKVQFDSRPLGA